MIEFEIVKDENECKKLWNEFSPKQLIWDLWDFRFCFYNNNYEFNFIVGFDGKEKKGIMPLVFDKKEKSYTYFGDEFPEQNRLLLKDKTNARLFLEKCPKNTLIPYISFDEKKHYDFAEGAKRYFLNLDKHGNSFENYLKSFKKKHRKNLRYDIKNLEHLGYEIEHEKDMKNFGRIAELNRICLGNDSDYNDRDFELSMMKLAEEATKMNIIDMTIIQINKNTEAAGLGFFYNNIYTVSAFGRNPKIDNLGKLLIIEHIKSAISHNCREIDFMSTDAEWKELWNFDSQQLYEYKK